MGRLTNRLLPRKTLNGRKYTITYDQYNYPTETFETIKLEECSVQPITGYKQSTLPEGFRDSKVYRVFTKTNVFPRIEGNDTRFQVEVRAGLWCDVIDADTWEVGVQSHFELTVVEPNER